MEACLEIGLRFHINPTHLLWEPVPEDTEAAQDVLHNVVQMLGFLYINDYLTVSGTNPDEIRARITALAAQYPLDEGRE